MLTNSGVYKKNFGCLKSIKLLWLLLLLFALFIACGRISGNLNLTNFPSGCQVAYQWQNVGPAGFTSGAAQYTVIAFDSSGAPYVAYRDAANGNKATVMKYTAGTWSIVGAAGFSAGTADYLSIV